MGSGTGSESGESGESGVGCLGLFKESETLGWGCGYGACVGDVGMVHVLKGC